MYPKGKKINLKASKIYNFKVVCMTLVGSVINAVGVMFNFKLDPLNENSYSNVS